MELIQDYHHEAFSTLVRRHTERFYALAYKTLFNQTEAEDIVQECFLKVWHKPSIWRKNRKTKFTTWFYRVVVNACYDHNKRKSSGSHVSEELDLIESGQGDPEATALNKEVENALMSLPMRQRTAVILCFIEGLSNQEAADVLGIRLKAFQSLLMRGKEALKIRLNLD